MENEEAERKPWCFCMYEPWEPPKPFYSLSCGHPFHRGCLRDQLRFHFQNQEGRTRTVDAAGRRLVTMTCALCRRLVTRADIYHLQRQRRSTCVVEEITERDEEARYFVRLVRLVAERSGGEREVEREVYASEVYRAGDLPQSCSGSAKRLLFVDFEFSAPSPTSTYGISVVKLRAGHGHEVVKRRRVECSIFRSLEEDFAKEFEQEGYVFGLRRFGNLRVEDRDNGYDSDGEPLPADPDRPTAPVAEQVPDDAGDPYTVLLADEEYAPPSSSSPTPLPSIDDGDDDTFGRWQLPSSPATSSPSSSPPLPSLEDLYACEVGPPLPPDPPRSDGYSPITPPRPSSPGHYSPPSPCHYSPPSASYFDRSPRYFDRSPSRVPQSPGHHSPTLPIRVPQSPRYTPQSPSHTPASTLYSDRSHSHAPSSPVHHSPLSPSYVPQSASYVPQSPSYSPLSPSYVPQSPSYTPLSPSYTPALPRYTPASPSYSPQSPGYTPALPAPTRDPRPSASRTRNPPLTLQEELYGYRRPPSPPPPSPEPRLELDPRQQDLQIRSRQQDLQIQFRQQDLQIRSRQHEPRQAVPGPSRIDGRSRYWADGDDRQSAEDRNSRQARGERRRRRLVRSREVALDRVRGNVENTERTVRTLTKNTRRLQRASEDVLADSLDGIGQELDVQRVEEIVASLAERIRRLKELLGVDV